ncbi:bifunctional aldolase/short-chain dehydrogenase [Cuniculiplasma sp. SKW4]|uniref:bifunctional aldolase/short-chain dehydrogenase n=1 Tax=Cuniculiplasma sp. SKW4 TaxID=3400171 RepID=UPI003FCF78A2
MAISDDRIATARKLGSDKDLVLHGGGNASVKLVEIDHAGRQVKVLRVKGSGSDMATIDEKGFTGVRMDDILLAKDIKAMTDGEMMDYLKKSMIDPSEPSPSVETFLHGFIPYTFVDHSHSDFILMLTNTSLSDSEIKKILGNVVVVPYIPPGFTLAKEILKIMNIMTPDVEGIVLRKHGLFTFGETAKESYDKHMRIVERAKKFIKDKIGDIKFNEDYENMSDFEEIIPEIRGIISSLYKKTILVDRSDEVLGISKSKEGEKFAKSGPATPDMLIRTKYDYLYLSDSTRYKEEIENFKNKYTEEYREYVKEFPMHDPYPSIILMRGFGAIFAARTFKECKILRDQFIHSMRVNTVASRIGNHEFITRKEAYNMEYWPLEEAKLKKFVPRKNEGGIGLVTGAANGIGLEATKRLAETGMNVIAADIDPRVVEVAKEIGNNTKTRTEGFIVDLSKPEEVEKLMDFIERSFGGIDVVFQNAGILKSEYLEEIKLDTLMKHIEINSVAPFIISQRAFNIMRRQGIGGNFVFNITKNLTHPGPGMTSYGSSKAFSAQLSHYIAKEGGKFGIRSNIINPDKIFKNSKIWENGVLEARAKAKGITEEEYKRGNLLRKEVLPEHVANMLLAMIDEDIFGATTDAMVPVDGGIL